MLSETIEKIKHDVELNHAPIPLPEYTELFYLIIQVRFLLF